MPIDSKVRKVIKKQGHIKIDEMMRQILSVNKGSYYRTKKDIGAKGDFITAPEISQLFGEVTAFWAIEQWEKMGCPKPFLLLELGPGQGVLMQDLLRVAKLKPEFFAAANIHLLEINPYFKAKQKSNLNIYGKELTWLKSINEIPKIPIIMIANEFFDAMPIKQYKKIKKKWYESTMVIDPLDGRIKYSNIAIKERLEKQLNQDHPNAKDGAIFEESIESLEIVRFLARHIKKYTGSSLIIDYGYDIATKSRQRGQYNSTLQAIKNHQYHSVIDSMGEADLTAHVDFQALKKAARQQGIKEYDIYNQAGFLQKYGIILRYQNLQKKLPADEKQILAKQLYRLTDKTQMGELFKVLVIANFQTLMLSDN
ncbi:MAG: SAM-dependent methyltransferase [Rickettsiaceae bacterium]|nr:SAM-dependent methyltransferase [Rickettsiaceae bacterium]